jgi:hypothetical protein
LDRMSGGPSQTRVVKHQRDHRGPAGSERLVLGEHVPDGGGELAGKLDPGDLRSALAAEALLRVFVPFAIGGMAGGVGGRLDQLFRSFRSPRKRRP